MQKALGADAERPLWVIQPLAPGILFEQAARIIRINDKRMWRIVEHDDGKTVACLDMSSLSAIGLDDAVARRGLELMSRAGFDPAKVVKTWERMQAKTSANLDGKLVQRAAAFLSDHPASVSR
jgi:hypothetical protein